MRLSVLYDSLILPSSMTGIIIMIIMLRIMCVCRSSCVFVGPLVCLSVLFYERLAGASLNLHVHCIVHVVCFGLMLHFPRYFT